ncbi:MAG TPA: hypothetical protein VI911_00600 [Patescibacteria group bacterium]|nr:hypothetical protein [Patescibacteria group bacterium]
MIKTKEQAITRIRYLDDLYFETEKDKQGLILLEIYVILHRLATNYYGE